MKNPKAHRLCSPPNLKHLLKGIAAVNHNGELFGFRPLICWSKASCCSFIGLVPIQIDPDLPGVIAVLFELLLHMGQFFGYIFLDMGGCSPIIKQLLGVGLFQVQHALGVGTVDSGEVEFFHPWAMAWAIAASRSSSKAST